MPPFGCYAITTRKFNLFHDHREWFTDTQTLYNKVLGFYCGLYMEMWGGNESETDGGSEDLQGQNGLTTRRLPNNREAMGILEKLTIPGRDGRAPEKPLPYGKVPLYFRRAAINAAIAAAKSALARGEKTAGEHPTDIPCGNGRQEEDAVPAGIPAFRQSVTYYKGMYKDLTDRSVTLKVWNGEKWIWTECKLSGNHLPKDAQVMSPSVVVREKTLELHVPVREEVVDGRNAKERMAAGEKMVSAVFTNEDACVVCCVADGHGDPSGRTLFVRGGKEYAHKCRQVMEQLEKSQESTAYDGNAKANQRYWMRLKHLNDSYSHLFSRKVIDYCTEQGAKVLVLPLYRDTYSSRVMPRAGNYSPLHLSYQIREKLKYKAWKAGIVVLETEQLYISSTCAICGAKARRVRKNRNRYVCENGHSGNAYLNMARNLCRRCAEGFWEERE